uniref:Uncharacterized protein n=1 Tax=Ananas comosus var. bracteatus TaxID=296719 RepID=A0A6V7Q3Y4_ANACO|nr:unnamed protein product [Ananas comosus var. bracteatus]
MGELRPSIHDRPQGLGISWTSRVTHWTCANCGVRVIGCVLSCSTLGGGSQNVFRPKKVRKPEFWMSPESFYSRGPVPERRDRSPSEQCCGSLGATGPKRERTGSRTSKFWGQVERPVHVGETGPSVRKLPSPGFAQGAKLRDLVGFCYSRGPIWPLLLLFSLIPPSHLLLEREEEEGEEEEEEEESLLEAWIFTHTLSSPFWWLGPWIWSLRGGRSPHLEDLGSCLGLLKDLWTTPFGETKGYATVLWRHDDWVFETLTTLACHLCSFAHACESRSLQAGTPELAYATYARSCGIEKPTGRRIDLEWKCWSYHRHLESSTLGEARDRGKGVASS